MWNFVTDVFRFWCLIYLVSMVALGMVTGGSPDKPGRVAKWLRRSLVVTVAPGMAFIFGMAAGFAEAYKVLQAAWVDIREIE